jgi:hypothetical protein
VLRHLAVIALFTGFLMLAPVPAHAAHGPLLRGRQLDQNTTISDTTGECSCQVKWFTIGLAPGIVRIAAQPKSSMFGGGPTYGMSVLLYRGSAALTWGQTSCQTTHRRCSKVIHLTYRIKQRGVYYLQIVGLGAQVIPYTMQVHGVVFPLHCGKYC